jgi:hypothetical protein
MKIPELAILLVLSMTATAYAQDTLTQDEARAQMHSGTVKVRLGIALIGAGSLAIPITAAKGRSRTREGVVIAGAGTIAAGTYLVWRGASEQRKAVGRALTFSAFVGRTTGIQIRKIW